MPNSKRPGPEYVMQSTLLTERGWSKRLIKQLLGEPDQTQRNWQFKSAPPIRYYRLERVVEAETKPDHQKLWKRMRARRENGKKAAGPRWDKIFEAAETTPITVPQLPRDELLRRAFRRSTAQPPDGDEDDKIAAFNTHLMASICVDYLRDEVAEYDRTLAKPGQSGWRKFNSIIQQRVLLAIAEAYPWLEEACNRRLEWV